jgi:hypothetical protein
VTVMAARAGWTAVINIAAVLAMPNLTIFRFKKTIMPP